MTAPNPLTLESVASAFVDWRSHRAHRREAVPIALQQQAVALLEQHTQAEVLRALQINSKMIRRWRQTHAPETVPQFVTLTESALPASSDLRITLSHPQGGRMEIAGALDAAQLAALAHLVWGGRA